MLVNSLEVVSNRVFAERSQVPDDRPPQCGPIDEHYHTKQTLTAPSQNTPSELPRVASDMTLADTYVGLCDSHGCVVGRSRATDRLQVGEELWKNAASRSGEFLTTAVASVGTLRENRLK